MSKFDDKIKAQLEATGNGYNNAEVKRIRTAVVSAIKASLQEDGEAVIDSSFGKFTLAYRAAKDGKVKSPIDGTEKPYHIPEGVALKFRPAEATKRDLAGEDFADIRAKKVSEGRAKTEKKNG